MRGRYRETRMISEYWQLIRHSLSGLCPFGSSKMKLHGFVVFVSLKFLTLLQEFWTLLYRRFNIFALSFMKVIFLIKKSLAMPYSANYFFALVRLCIILLSCVNLLWQHSDIESSLLSFASLKTKYFENFFSFSNESISMFSCLTQHGLYSISCLFTQSRLSPLTTYFQPTACDFFSLYVSCSLWQYYLHIKRCSGKNVLMLQYWF